MICRFWWQHINKNQIERVIVQAVVNRFHLILLYGRTPMPAQHPNFLFVGPDKSGSSWLYQALRAHNQVYLPDVKELFFFDRHYHRGWKWYQGFFREAHDDFPVVGEISHDYLFSSKACKRIARHLPSAKLMVCLREPAQRAFSAYLYMVKQGRIKTDFDKAIHEVDELIEHGRYAKHLKMYLDIFRRECIHVAAFDDLADDPQKFLDELCLFLNIRRMELLPELRRNVLPSARPRSFVVARLARSAGWQLRRIGMPQIVSRVKESSLINRILYDTYLLEEKPSMSASARELLRKTFTPEVQQLDSLLGSDFCKRWGYPQPPEIQSLRSSTPTQART